MRIGEKTVLAFLAAVALTCYPVLLPAYSSCSSSAGGMEGNSISHVPLMAPDSGGVAVSLSVPPGARGYGVQYFPSQLNSRNGPAVRINGIHQVALASQPPAGDDASVASGRQNGCGPIRLSCGALCAQIYSDPAGCGACGKECPGGQICENGKCVEEPSAPCGPGLAACSGSCVNLLADGAHCGACGYKCGGGQTCRQGICQSRQAPKPSP